VFGQNWTDVRWARGQITECGTGLRAAPVDDAIDARGGWLVPGLHDHHIHLRALAALDRSVPVGPPQVPDADALARHLRQADADLPPGRWVRAVGYHESVAGELDRWVLDAVLADRPVRIQHRSGALWVLNSRACHLAGVDECPLPGVDRDRDGRATGRLWRMDAWLGQRLAADAPDPTVVSARAAALGVAGFTDATPGLRQEELQRYAADLAARRIVQRVHCMAPPDITTPEWTQPPEPGSPRFTLGPTKFLLDDTTLPTLDDFAAQIRDVHTAGKAVAVHCVTGVQLVLTMAALDLAGVRRGDRIEHGAIIPSDTLDWLRDRAITIVTQPHFPVERAEQYARTVPDAERPDLWRLGSLLTAGVPVAAGTDAPFGGADPWQVVRAATERAPENGSDERISAESALRLFLGHPDLPAVPRRIEPGAPADLTLLRVPPQDLASALPEGDLVAATVIAGTPVHLADGVLL
jgi:predicted amidohydrolase YtcJ